MAPQIAIFAGPTGTGKTALAIQLAKEHGNIEIINGDSIAVYRHVDIGSAKPSPTERSEIPHHLIDIKNPDEEFTAGDFVRAVEHTSQEILSRGNRPLIVGGSGFYLKLLIRGLWEFGERGKSDEKVRTELEKLSNEELHQKLMEQDPDSLPRVSPNDRYRMVRSLEIIQTTGKTPTRLQQDLSPAKDSPYLLWVLNRPNEALHPRLRLRSQKMIKDGIVEEVEFLRKHSPDCRALKSVGYAQVVDYLQGNVPQGRKIPSGLAGLEEEIFLATRQLVKRQRTWFRGQEEATWFDLEEPQDQEKLKTLFWEAYS